MDFIKNHGNDVFTISDIDIISHKVVTSRESGCSFNKVKFQMIVNERNRCYLDFFKDWKEGEIFDILYQSYIFINCRLLSISSTVSKLGESLETKFLVSAERIVNARQFIMSKYDSKDEQPKSSSKLDEACKAITMFMKSS